MNDRVNPVYDIVKPAYCSTLQIIKDNLNLLQERECVVCMEDSNVYIKINGILRKITTQEVV